VADRADVCLPTPVVFAVLSKLVVDVKAVCEFCNVCRT